MHCYVCLTRACMHIVLRRSADACLIVPILADHPGGAARCHAVRVVRAGLPLRPCRPSGHSREEEEGGKGLRNKRRWHGWSSSKEVEVCLVHVMCYACVDRLCTRAAYICRIHRSLQVSCYHGVARNWGAALPRCRCMPVCGVSVLFRLNIYFGGIARLEHQISPTQAAQVVMPQPNTHSGHLL